jgi:hypothetical protein
VAVEGYAGAARGLWQAHDLLLSGQCSQKSLLVLVDIARPLDAPSIAKFRNDEVIRLHGVRSRGKVLDEDIVVVKVEPSLSKLVGHGEVRWSHLENADPFVLGSPAQALLARKVQSWS